MFRDRIEAGRALAERLREHEGEEAAVVLGIPRGGVVLAREVASALHLPLDVLVVRKVGHPANPEFAAGAVDPDGGLMVNPHAGLSRQEVESTAGPEVDEARRRAEAYRQGRKELDLSGMTAVLVDDGIATGLTARKAVDFARRRGAARVVMAAPVMSPEAHAVLSEEADDVVAVDVPAVFGAVGQFYRVFPQITDSEVVETLSAPVT